MLETADITMAPETRLMDYVEGATRTGPTYEVPGKKVAIVGFAPSSLKVALDVIFRNERWTKENGCEIWGLNELYKVLEHNQISTDRWDRWFDIHDPRSSISTRDSDNVKWLAAQTKPIYMTQHFADIPASVSYPLKEIISYWESDYLTNTIAMMILLAAMEGRALRDMEIDGKLVKRGTVIDESRAFSEIQVWGVDMAQDSEYSHQRPSCEGAICFARGLGIKVYVPPTSDLMKIPFIYGYQGDGQALRQKIDARIGELKGQADGHRQVGNNAKMATAALIAVCNEMAAIVNKFQAENVQHPVLEALKARIQEIQPEIAKTNSAAEANLMRAAMLDGAHDDAAFWRRSWTGA